MNTPRRQELRDRKIEDLEARLYEAEETLRAIRNGEVDALVISAAEGEKIYTLKTAEHPYRILVEAMSEGAATLDEAGTVLYCNGSFARILKAPSERVLGVTFGDLVVPADRPRYESILHQSRTKNAKGEVRMISGGDQEVEVLISLSPLTMEEVSGMSLVLTDLSGTPMFLPIAIGALDGNGNYALTGTTPPGLAGTTMTCIGYAIGANGHTVIDSSPETLVFK